MMTTSELLTRLNERQVLLCPAGDRLRFTPPDAVDEELREELRRHKPAILSLIPSGWPKDVPLPVWWLEVAGVFPAGFLRRVRRQECSDSRCRFSVAVEWYDRDDQRNVWSCPACGLGAGCLPDCH